MSNFSIFTYSTDVTSSIQSAPTLGVIVSQLRNCVEYFNREKVVLESLRRQKSNTTSFTFDTSAQAQQTNLTERLLGKQSELKLTAFIVEQSLYLLWAHLDFYMLKSVGMNHFGNDTLLRSDTAGFPVGWRVTSEDVKQLKKALVSVITETFSKQLLNTASDQSTNEKGFIEALLRRTKRLIQFAPV